jgi:hypothetical protein
LASSSAQEGCYLLRTNVSEWSEAELWQITWPSPGSVDTGFSEDGQ